MNEDSLSKKRLMTVIDERMTFIMGLLYLGVFITVEWKRSIMSFKKPYIMLNGFFAHIIRQSQKDKDFLSIQ